MHKLYQKAFPDFVLDVELPEGFEDTSWRNDACPSFTHEASKTKIWIDYADTALREFPDSSRFSVEIYEPDTILSEDDRWLLWSDDWSEVVALVQKRRELA
jgi:hypothetical protein